MLNIEKMKEAVITIDAPTSTSWIFPIKDYIEYVNLPLDRIEATLINMRANGYIMVGGSLYK